MMKKLLCLILAMILCLASCGKTESVLQENIIQEDSDIVFNYEPILEAYNDDAGLFEIYKWKDKTFLVTAFQDFWHAQMYYVNNENGEVTLEETAANGFRDRFDVNFIETSQGTFIAAICTSHIGNGDLRLIPIDDYTKVKYSIPASRAMSGNEWLDQFNYQFEYGSDSTDFYGGHMFPDYTDVNGDGHTDIVLRGIQFVKNRERTEIVGRYYCEYTYIYDSADDTFELDVSRSRHNDLNG